MLEAEVFVMVLCLLATGAIGIGFSHLPTAPKCIVVAAMIYGSILALLSIQEFKGNVRPVSETPSKIKVIHHEVGKEKKKIRILMQDMAEEGAKKLYIEVDYSQSMHKALSQGTKMSKGAPFVLEKETEGEGKEGAEKGNGKKGGKEGGKKGSKSLSQLSEAYRAYKLPATVMPDKEYD
jgi:hypothetical protein